MTLALRLALPEDRLPQPLPMPDQDLHAPFTDPAAPGCRSPVRTRVLRALFLMAPLFPSAVLGWSSFDWFALDAPPGVIEIMVVAVTMFAFYWIALSFFSALLGLFWRPSRIAEPAEGLSIAILLPMYGEAAAPTIGAATRLLAGLADRGRHSVSLHVLSDSREPDAVRREEAEILAMRRAHPQLTIRYRRRARNTDYKSGNIRDWVVAQGRDHDAMLILDADSIMGAGTVQRMADLLATQPGLGLVQSVPRVLPGETLWQRLQSFASEVYGLNMAHGFAMWTGTEGNFLGHNALLRTRAFAASAGLPHLSGRPPRGGVILSHDFVEAALMRRAGWGVKLLPEATESFEATPATLPGYLRRDRRWCQGNMQHLRMLTTPGLHPVSRFHLLQGAMAYIASVWWMSLLILWTLAGHAGGMPDFFADNPIKPSWPVYPALSQGFLLGLVVLMLIGPKVAGIAAHIRDRGLSWAQVPGFSVSVLLEVTLSLMVAPTLMVHQVRAVLRTLAGVDGGWSPHDSGRPTLPMLLRVHATETGLGLSLIGLYVIGHLTPWLLPIAISLALSVPLSWLVQRDVTVPWVLRPLSGVR